MLGMNKCFCGYVLRPFEDNKEKFNKCIIYT